MATFLPQETSEATGQTITLILSIVTATLRVAWLFIALMLPALAIIVATELSWICTTGGSGLGSDRSERAGAR
jgi:hypothetical protein